MLNLRRSLSTCSAYSETDVKYAVDVQNVVFGYQKNIKVLNKMTFRAVEGIIQLLVSNKC